VLELHPLQPTPAPRPASRPVCTRVSLRNKYQPPTLSLGATSPGVLEAQGRHEFREGEIEIPEPHPGPGLAAPQDLHPDQRHLPAPYPGDRVVLDLSFRFLTRKVEG
jgi:hypothetical protein